MKQLSVFLVSIVIGCAGTRRAVTMNESVQMALKRGDAQGAIALLEPAYAAHPEDLTLARLRAQAYVMAGKSQVLLNRLSKEDSAVSHYQQGLVHFARSVGPAIAEFRKAAAQDPTKSEFHYRLGVALLESEQCDAALPALERANTLQTSRIGWLLPLAKARACIGDRHGAVNAIRTVILDEPSRLNVQIAIALMGQLEDPFAAFPNAARTQLEKAMHWLQSSEAPQLAIVELEEILSNFPHLGVVHALLGLAYNQLHNISRAVTAFKRAIELDPNNGKNYFYLAEAYQFLKKPKRAENYYEKAVEKNPVLAQAWIRLGDFSIERKDFSNAARNFEIALRLHYEDNTTREKLAVAHQLRNDWSAADRELRTLIKEDPNNFEYILRMGILHAEHCAKAKSTIERTKACRKGKKWLRKALDAQPDNTIANSALMRLEYFSHGKTEQP